MSTPRKITSTNFENEQRFKMDCPMQYALEQIGGRWKMMIVWYIHVGVNRFSELRRHIPNITTKMLAQQLQELQKSGFIMRIVLSERPAHVEYRLNRRAQQLIPVLAALNDWAIQDQATLILTG